MAVIKNERDIALQAAPYRLLTISNLGITTTVPSFVKSAAGVVTPASATITVTVNSYIAPIYTWYSVKGATVTLIPGATASSLIVTSSAFNSLVGSDSIGAYRCVISQASYPTETLEISMLLIREGVPGAAGPSGQSIKAVASAFVFNINTSGASTPSSTVCKVERTPGIQGAAVNGDYVWTVTSGTFTGSLSTINSSTGAMASFGPSAMSTDSVTFKCVYTVSTSGSAYLGQSFTDYVTISKLLPAQKSTEVSCFKWATSAPSVPTQSSTLTWSNSYVSNYPSGWSSSAPAAPSSGYTLYQLNVRVSETDGAVASTNFNWNTGTVGTIGYREDGSIGPQGPGSRIAYMVTTSGTPPALGATQPVSGDTLPNGSSRPGSTSINTWSATPKATLAEGEFMYQSDGVYDPVTNNTTWQLAYLSNLKVGNLSALSAKLGVVEVAASGALYSGKTSFSSTAAGFHLGYSGSAYTFAIGNSGDTKSMKWDGTDLKIKGGIIEGSTIRSGVTGARFEIGGYNNQLVGYNAGGIQQVFFSFSSGILKLKSDTVGDMVVFTHSVSGLSLRLEKTNVSSPTHGSMVMQPVEALPTSRENGSVCFYNGNICVANGSDWYTPTTMTKLT